MDTNTPWVKSTNHPGYFVKIIQRGNCTIEVLRPELLDERERTKRTEQLKRVAESTLRNYYNRKERRA